MKKGLTEVVFILDRSGSMGGLESDTIGGFNSMLEKQKNEEGEAVISTVLFDDKCEVLHDRQEVGSVDAMTNEQYYVRGCTALLDAIGGSIHHIGKLHKHMAEDDVPEKTVFIITTDGLENSSHFYSYEKVKKMIEKKKEKNGWEFLFLGANIDAVKEAARFGIAENRAVNYKCDSVGTAKNYNAISATVSLIRKTGAGELGSKKYEACMGACLDDVREYYQESQKGSD